MPGGPPPRAAGAVDLPPDLLPLWAALSAGVDAEARRPILEPVVELVRAPEPAEPADAPFWQRWLPWSASLPPVAPGDDGLVAPKIVDALRPEGDDADADGVWVVR